jgi:hypothetical protein
MIRTRELGNWNPRTLPVVTPTMSKRSVGAARASLALLVLGLGVSSLSAQAVSRCNFYASPAGRGDGTSPEKPFRVERFWQRATPGSTLCLLDGTYADAESMINPPPGLSGSPGRPITIRALHDGKVLIDAQGKGLPVRIHQNNWFVVEGVNACCASATVVSLTRSSHNVIRRVAAWDAAEGNHSIFGVHYGEHNLLEDVAGWGIARKIYESSQGGDFTTIRRGWGRWEGSHVTGPKVVYSLAYNNYSMLVENSIGTWSGEKMKESYVLLDYYGKPWVGYGEGTYQNHDVNQPYGVFGIDALKDDKKARARLLGSIAYIRASDSFKAPQLVFVTKLDAVEIADTLAYIEPGSYPRVKTFGLYGLLAGATSLLARNITGLGGAGALIRRDWETRNVLEGSSLAVYGSTESAFNSTRGANLCRRYVDGVLTHEPLWPWPMNQRIIEATRQSGRSPVDVTATVESMIGAIPTECVSNKTASLGETRFPKSRPRTAGGKARKIASQGDNGWRKEARRSD